MEKDGNKIRVQTERTVDGGIWFYASAIKKKKQETKAEKGEGLMLSHGGDFQCLGVGHSVSQCRHCSYSNS